MALRPRLLDLFCGAGGAAVGYSRAGFDVVGVDIKPQPHYPFEFHQADALEFLRALMYGGVGSDKGRLDLSMFDAIHASPPCQAYTWAAKRWTEVPRADLAGPTRRRLEATSVPYVIENVEAAGPLIGANLFLCGQMFGLGVIRHRVFAVRPPLGLAPHHPPCSGLVKAGLASTVAGAGGDTRAGRIGIAHKRRDMGIDWMTKDEINEAIPPAYTTWIGAQLIASLEAVA